MDRQELEEQEQIAIREEGNSTDRLPGLLSTYDILNTEFPAPTWIIPEMLSVGVAILGGRPKTGKSWMGLQLGQAVASGGVVFGKKVDPGRVLIIALEDHPRRLKDRMQKQGWSPGLPADFITSKLFRERFGDLGKGGGQLLAKQIERWQYRFVVVDTLSRAIGVDQNDVNAVTNAIGSLQEVAQNLNTSILLIDHHKKALADPDAVSDILGSTGKGAVGDCLWGLYRQAGKVGAKLILTGRDIEEQSLKLNIDWETGLWSCEGEASLYELSGRQGEIIEFLQDAGACGITDIGDALGINKGSAYKILSDLVNRGTILKSGKGRGGVKYSIL
ncbi:MAG: AAA family ATPase [Deltaproteobacteria bacterium]|uniref:AAA family ATPase n=1 Tax=Candidatus Zymogenus saltonus TaxID=2844893 RepID=A0A9D8KKP3_9DELT|nr:AAA family ATPase [Candidatus Zymogenus saltonus]